MRRVERLMIGEFAALGAAISWAVAPLLYKEALSGVSPFSANVVRCVSNAVVLLLVLVVSGTAALLFQLPLWIVAVVVVSGVVGLGLGDSFYLSGLKSIGVSRAVPLASTYPLFSLLWATLFLGQRVSAAAVVGTVLILSGIWLLSRKHSEKENQTHNRIEMRGVLFSLATALFWLVSITLMDFGVTTPGVVTGLEANYAMVAVRIAGMSLVMLGLAPLVDRSRGFLRFGWRAIALLCVGGLVANGLGWVLMNFSFLNIVEAQAVPISATTPLFSSLAGFVFFRERVTVNDALGAVLVVAGTVLIFVL